MIIPTPTGITTMFTEAPMNPAELAAMTSATDEKNSAPRRGRKAKEPTQPTGHAPSATFANEVAKPVAKSKARSPLVSTPIASSAATTTPEPTRSAPRAGKPHTDDGQATIATQCASAVVGSPIPDAANDLAQPEPAAPYPGTHPSHHDRINSIIEVYRLRQDMIRARTKLILQAQASLRRGFNGDKDLAAKTFAEASKDLAHDYRGQISPYLGALEILDEQQSAYEKWLVRDVKGLPIYAWAKAIKGFGDLSLACIIGETSGFANDDIYYRGKLHLKAGQFYSVGDFKCVSALWKRMGLAVLNGHRQGNPGKGATADDWVKEGYSKTKRSVMWNVGNSLILSMGKFRPMFGEDVDANPEYTVLQKVFANRCRYEAQRLPSKDGTPIKESATGKESYSLHAANRAKRYTEKRLLRMLYSEWRRVMA